MKTATLPDKPSELIRVALADLRKVEAMPDVYRVDMSYWHHPRDGKCSVCFAGAVMAQTIKLDVDAHVSAYDDRFDIETENKLEALNSFREGAVGDGLSYLGRYSDWHGEYYRDVTPYSDDREAFHCDMQTLASDLEAVGL